MKYKISKYNYIIENKQGDILLFNSLIGKASMLKIKDNYKSMISNILDRTEYSIENPNYLESQLIKFGYLIPREKDEEKIIKNIFEKTINDKQLSLIIAP